MSRPIYGASGNYGGSTSNVVTQVVKSLATHLDVLTQLAQPVELRHLGRLSPTPVSASSGTPTGSVTFYSCTTTHVLAPRPRSGPGPLRSGKAIYPTSSLPGGTAYVEAIYSASGNYGGSTSNVVSQVVNVGSSQRVCHRWLWRRHLRQPGGPVLVRDQRQRLHLRLRWQLLDRGFDGNDCIDAGDGNNVIFDGDGNDGVSAGNGSNAVVLGNGNDKVSPATVRTDSGRQRRRRGLGAGSDDTVRLGNGTDTVTVGNGSGGQVIVGNGNDTITVGTGSYNDVDLGNGTDTVTIQGSHDDINGGNGNETIYLGSGTYNSYSGQVHHTNVCHLPPPSSYTARTAPTTTTQSRTARWCRHEAPDSPPSRPTVSLVIGIWRGGLRLLHEPRIGYRSHNCRKSPGDHGDGGDLS